MTVTGVTVALLEHQSHTTTAIDSKNDHPHHEEPKILNRHHRQQRGRRLGLFGAFGRGWLGGGKGACWGF